MSLTYKFGVFDEEMVLYLTILTLSALDNASYFYSALGNLVCMSGGRRKEYMF